MGKSMRYEDAGVDYTPLDAFKRTCQQEANQTREMLRAHGLSEVAGIRGESAYLIEAAEMYLAHVEEGLGSKNLVADALAKLTGKCHYAAIGIDTVATIVNDLITVGALPISVAMHAGVGDSGWFNDTHRAAELARGFAEGCRRSGAVWGGGETPTLKQMIDPATIVLAGSAMGWIKPKSLRIAGEPEAGDAMVMLASTGVHTNGLTLCRALAERLPEGYLTKLASGRSYGEALLEASHIYVPFVAACQQAKVGLHYAVHMTGHGWRKLMRARGAWVYRVERLGEVPEVFEFLMERGPIELREAYATFNMGVGFVVYVAEAEAERCVRLAKDCGFEAWRGGSVRAEAGRKAVVIEPLGLSYEAESLAVR